MLVDFAHLLFSALQRYLARLQRAQLTAHDAKRDRYGSWSCSDCGQTFGPDVQYVNYATDNVVPSARGPFTRHVIITCQHCALFNVFDPVGNPLYQSGEYIKDRALISRHLVAREGESFAVHPVDR